MIENIKRLMNNFINESQVYSSSQFVITKFIAPGKFEGQTWV